MSLKIGNPSTTSAASNAPAGAPSAATLRTWDSSAGLPQSEVPLAELEAGLTLDDRCAEPIRFLPDRGLLCYRGRMSHASFVHLQGLSRDRRYHRALEELFVATSMPPAPPAAQKLGWWAAAGVAVALLAAGWLGWRGLGTSGTANASSGAQVVAADSNSDVKPRVQAETASAKEPSGATGGQR